VAGKEGGKHSHRQLLHVVFGGKRTALDKIEFADLRRLDLVGIYPNYAQAYEGGGPASLR
jgi:hypothetical protein